MGFKLVDMGFDVWLNNSRGNKFSKDHQYYDLKNPNKNLPEIREQQKKFWDFSFHELGVYDQPALWNFVMKHTGVSKVSYICHSQGFTQMYISMMAYPEFYRKHMKCCIGMAPVTTMDYLSSTLVKTLAPNQMVINMMERACPSVLENASAFNSLMKHIHSQSTIT